MEQPAKILWFLVLVFFIAIPQRALCMGRANPVTPQQQYEEGVRYYFGEGVEKDYTKAFEWFSKAAEQGDADAQFSLGVMYSEGQGVGQNYEKAFEWYSKAAVQRNARAQLRTYP